MYTYIHAYIYIYMYIARKVCMSVSVYVGYQTLSYMYVSTHINDIYICIQMSYIYECLFMHLFIDLFICLFMCMTCLYTQKHDYLSLALSLAKEVTGFPHRPNKPSPQRQWPGIKGAWPNAWEQCFPTLRFEFTGRGFVAGCRIIRDHGCTRARFFQRLTAILHLTISAWLSSLLL